jgi:hypothetical protein
MTHPIRIGLLDSNLNKISTSNRLPVDALFSGEISIGSVYTVPPNTATIKLTGAQSSTTLVTPPTGKKLQIIGVMITSNDSLFTCTVEFLTSGKIVQEHYEQGTLGLYIPVNITGDTDEPLSVNISDSSTENWFFVINYVEVD